MPNQHSKENVKESTILRGGATTKGVRTMAIKTYKKGSKEKLSTNFKVSEYGITTEEVEEMFLNFCKGE